MTVSKTYGTAVFVSLLVCSIASGLEFNHGDWKLSLHDCNGSWNQLFWKGKLICSNPEKRNLLWVKREKMEGKILLKDAVMDEKKGILTVRTRQGKWNFSEKITFGKNLRRQFSVTWTGKEPVRMWEHNTAFPLSKKGTFFLPCSMFGDLRTYYEEITQMPDHLDRCRGDLRTLKAGDTIKGSMDHAGFVFVQPEPDYAVSLIADAATLPSRAFIKGLSMEVLCEFYAASCGWAEPGEAQTFPEFQLVVTPGTIDEAMKNVPHRYYRERGVVPPKDREDWLVDASIYELELGTHGGATQAAEKRLPYIRERGFNTLWIQPVEYLSPYNPENYFRIRKRVGTEQEYRKFIEKAHALGFRVLQDVVPHGSFARFAESRGVTPFTLSLNENGQCYENQCFDYSSPEWRNYFYRVITHWMEMGVDGFRVDQCGRSPANWRRPDFPQQAPKALRKEYWEAAVAKNGGKLPAIEGKRADHSLRLGPMKLTAGIRRTARTYKTDAAILGEGGNYMQPYCDVVVDMPIRHAILKMLFFSPEEYTRRYLDTMEEKYYLDPPDIRRVSLFEIHDNDFRASQIVGEAASQALRCTWFWNRSVPMVMDGRDLGQGILLSRLNLLRKNLEELRRGDIDFKAVKTKPLLFAPLRFMPEKSSICVTSFYPEPVEAELLIPIEKLCFPIESNVDLFDSFQGKKIASGKLEKFRKITYSLPPCGSTVLTFRRSGIPCPMPPIMSGEVQHVTPQSLTVKETAGNIEVCGNESLVIDKKTGMILRYGKLIGKSDLLSDANIPSIRPNIKWTRSGNTVQINVALGEQFSLIYTVKAEQLEVQGILKQQQRNSRYAFLLNASAADRWQLFGADGLRDDFINPVQINLKALGSFNGMHRDHLFSPILHRTFSMPLNPAFPVIRLWNGPKNSIEIVQNDPFDPAYDEVMLLNRAKETAGIHVAFFWNQPSPLSTASDKPRSFSFTIRPSTEHNPVEAATRIHGIDFRFFGINWLVDNGCYNAQFGKNGGVLNLFRLKEGKKTSVSKQDIVARGFTTAFHTPGRASYDMETHCRILRTPSGAELRFLSWLRNFANRGVIQPPIWNYMTYQLEPNVDRMESDWGIFVTQFPKNGKGELFWYALSRGKKLTIPVFPGRITLPKRKWLSFSADFSGEGVHPTAPRKKWENRTYPPMLDWNIRSYCDQRNYLARLASDMPENWKFKYIEDYIVLPANHTLVYQFDLPVMWPHTVTPVDLKAGRYRASTMLRTIGVRKSGAPGTIRFKLSYVDDSGKRRMIDRGIVIPDGDHDWYRVSAEFDVPAGVTEGEFTTLAYKVFGKGTVQFEEPILERIMP